MRRDDVIDAINQRVARIGIPRHLVRVQKIPARVELSVLVGADAHKLIARTGIPRDELERELERLELIWCERGNPDASKQMDIRGRVPVRLRILSVR